MAPDRLPGRRSKIVCADLMIGAVINKRDEPGDRAPWYTRRLSRNRRHPGPAMCGRNRRTIIAQDRLAGEMVLGEWRTRHIGRPDAGAIDDAPGKPRGAVVWAIQRGVEILDRISHRGIFSLDADLGRI